MVFYNPHDDGGGSFYDYPSFTLKPVPGYQRTHEGEEAVVPSGFPSQPLGLRAGGPRSAWEYQGYPADPRARMSPIHQKTEPAVDSHITPLYEKGYFPKHDQHYIYPQSQPSRMKGGRLDPEYASRLNSDKIFLGLNNQIEDEGKTSSKYGHFIGDENYTNDPLNSVNAAWPKDSPGTSEERNSFAKDLQPDYLFYQETKSYKADTGQNVIERLERLVAPSETKQNKSSRNTMRRASSYEEVFTEDSMKEKQFVDSRREPRDVVGLRTRIRRLSVDYSENIRTNVRKFSSGPPKLMEADLEKPIDRRRSFSQHNLKYSINDSSSSKDEPKSLGLLPRNDVRSPEYRRPYNEYSNMVNDQKTQVRKEYLQNSEPFYTADQMMSRTEGREQRTLNQGNNRITLSGASYAERNRRGNEDVDHIDIPEGLRMRNGQASTVNRDGREFNKMKDTVYLRTEIIDSAEGTRKFDSGYGMIGQQKQEIKRFVNTSTAHIGEPINHSLTSVDINNSDTRKTNGTFLTRQNSSAVERVIETSDLKKKTTSHVSILDKKSVTYNARDGLRKDEPSNPKLEVERVSTQYVVEKSKSFPSELESLKMASEKPRKDTSSEGLQVEETRVGVLTSKRSTSQPNDPKDRTVESDTFTVMDHRKLSSNIDRQNPESPFKYTSERREISTDHLTENIAETETTQDFYQWSEDSPSGLGTGEINKPTGEKLGDENLPNPNREIDYNTWILQQLQLQDGSPKLKNNFPNSKSSNYHRKGFKYVRSSHSYGKRIKQNLNRSVGENPLTYNYKQNAKERSLPISNRVYNDSNLPQNYASKAKSLMPLYKYRTIRENPKNNYYNQNAKEQYLPKVNVAYNEPPRLTNPETIYNPINYENIPNRENPPNYYYGQNELYRSPNTKYQGIIMDDPSKPQNSFSLNGRWGNENATNAIGNYEPIKPFQNEDTKVKVQTVLEKPKNLNLSFDGMYKDELSSQYINPKDTNQNVSTTKEDTPETCVIM